MTPPRPSRCSPATGSSPATGCSPATGFTLVELLVAAVVMVLASAGGSALFNQATRQAAQIRLNLEQQVAIASDLSAILELNDRYSCATGSCSATLPANPAAEPPPNQDQYAPSDPDDPGHTPTFRQRCLAGLLTSLLATLGSNTTLPGTTIQRTVVLDPANSVGGASVPPHRYLVTWRQGATTLRQVQLVPTVAAWCP
jgi:prepilin-type N-terminal cleavage/methylation domain-containing protein